MRISSYAMLAAVALTLTGYLASPCAEAVGQSTPVKVSIETENRQHAFHPGEQIVLLITVESAGDVEAELSSSSDTLDNKVSLTDATGNSPSLTAFGKKVTSVLGMLGPRRALRLRPGESKQISLDISQIYDVSRPGKYTVSISRFVRSPRGTAKSNPLTIVIRQKVVITRQKARPPDSAGARLSQSGSGRG
jgi:hypothetical protein